MQQEPEDAAGAYEKFYKNNKADDKWSYGVNTLILWSVALFGSSELFRIGTITDTLLVKKRSVLVSN